MNWLLGTMGALALLVLVGWAGLQVRPAPFPAPARPEPPSLRTVPLPGDLPAPVARFYRDLYGDEVPVIRAAVLSGRATLRVAGVPLPARWRFVHDVGHAYRHQIVTTWFGLPLLRVDERYQDGTARLTLPFGVEEGPAVDQGANLALWAEAMWFPAALVTDPRVRWTPVDDVTAVLHVPFGNQVQRFVVRFDPGTARVDLFEAMRFKGADATGKTLWLNRAAGWDRVDGHPTATRATVTWLDEGRPWAVFDVDALMLASERDPGLLNLE